MDKFGLNNFAGGKHATINHYIQNWNSDYGKLEDYCITGCVRNPWDRLVSQYQWRLAKGERDVAKRNFKEWVTWRWEGWLNWLENPRKVIRGVPQLGHRDRAVVLTKAFDEIYDEKENKILVDFVGRYENLQNGVRPQL